jgi:uncharacterized protein YPO0396
MTKQNLLAVLVLLFCVRFGLFPLWDWQDEQKQKLQQAAQHQAKVEHMLSQFSELSQQQQLSEGYAQEAKRLFPQVAEAEYRLQVQQQIQQIITAQQAQLQVFDWVTVSPVEGSKLLKANVNLRASGSPASVAMLHALLEDMPNLTMDTVNLTWYGTLNSSAEVTASFDFSVYFSSEEPNV